MVLGLIVQQITCNLSFKNYSLETFKQNCQVGVVFTDFEKTFDRVDHNILLVAPSPVGFGDPLFS